MTEQPLYAKDAAIRERLGISERKWREILPTWETQGFPQVDPIVGARFWPAVKAWFFNRHGLSDKIPIYETKDGEERWP